MPRSESMTTDAAPTPDDERAIEALLRRVTDGWNDGDGDAFAKPFDEEANYVVATGDRLDGRREIAAVHQRLFDGIFRGTRLWSRPVDVRYLAPDVVVICSEGAILFPGEEEGSVEPNGLTTTVCTKRQDEWRIASFQNTPTSSLRTVRFCWRYLISHLRRRT